MSELVEQIKQTTEEFLVFKQRHLSLANQLDDIMNQMDVLHDAYFKKVAESLQVQPSHFDGVLTLLIEGENPVETAEKIISYVKNNKENRVEKIFK